MCADLSDGDLNAIRRARGFSSAETNSRTSFANFFLTSVGLEQAIHSLSAEEALSLRLLHETGEVDVSFFERVYSSDYPHGTYTQRYKHVFDAVKKNLVRRGLIVMAEVKMRAEAVQLERWRFALPPEFAAYLPPLPSVKDDRPGKFNDYAIRKKLLELVGGTRMDTKDTLPIHIKHGSLYLNEFLFSVASFTLWQINAWQLALKVFKPNIAASLNPIDVAYKLVREDSWTEPKTLEPALQIFSYGGNIPPAEKLLHKGWEMGMFYRQEINSVAHYRLVPAIDLIGNDLNFTAWASATTKPDTIQIDLRLIPLQALAQLNFLAHLSVENGKLLASPSPAKLGRATPEQRSSALSLWLAQQIPAFGNALEHVNTHWGKTVLHENLLFARVRDLSLRVQLERELKNNIMILSDHFIAFPIESRASVEKVLKKTGFVTKIFKE